MIIEGDCIEAMKYFDENEFDAIVCDPPYGLEFMGKKWDKLRNTWQAEKGRYHNDTTFLAKGDRIRYKAGLEMQLWHTQWLTEAYRVLKPGGSMLVMGGTRTSHRLACAIEDSGFIIKDTLMWIYGSGFPKAQDLGKMIDKRAGAKRIKIGEKGGRYATPKRDFRGGAFHAGAEVKNGMFNDIFAPSTDLAKHWDGFKVGGIKPAYEPIIWAVKPPEGSYVDNVLKWGVGAVNVDECRVGYQNKEEYQKLSNNRLANRTIRAGEVAKGYGMKPQGLIGSKQSTKGRFPANIILSHHPECVQVGVKRVKSHNPDNKIIEGENTTPNAYGKYNRRSEIGHAKDGLETVESWDCHPDCAVRLLDEQSGNIKTGGSGRCISNKASFYGGGKHSLGDSGGDSGGASRFFYCAKASRGERNAGLKGMEEKEYHLPSHMNQERLGREGRKPMRNILNNHPTVKPIKLFEYLVKLVTREGQVILDPFLGSGTTMIAANNVNRICVGIEKEKDYCKIAKKRVRYWEKK